MSQRRKDGEEPKEDGVSIVAKGLAPQIASDNKFLINQESDHRVTAVLDPMGQAAMGYFDYRGKIDRVRFWSHIVDWELASTPSINGLGRRQIIQETAAAAGVGKGAIDIAEKPGWIARHITQRNWKEDAMRRGEVVEE